MANLLEFKEGFGILSGDVMYPVEYVLWVDDGFLLGKVMYHGESIGFTMCNTHDYRKLMRQAKFDMDSPEKKVAQGILGRIQEDECRSRYGTTLIRIPDGKVLCQPP